MVSNTAEEGWCCIFYTIPMDSYFDAYEDKDDILDIAINGFPEYHGKCYGLTFYPIPEPYIYRKDFFA